MTITLEEGKFYKTRGGQKVGPMKLVSEVGGIYPFRGADGVSRAVHSYTRDGCWSLGYHQSARDLVAEWVEEPCPAQVAVEGAPLPEPFTHGDVIPGMVALPDNSLGGMIDPSVFKSRRAPPDFPPSVLADIKTEIADTAKRIVSGARRAAYGTPEQNFERIARFWQAYFENTGRGAVKITARDVSPLMRLMKEARLAETPDHKDSFVDLVGYTLTGAEVNGVLPEGLTSSV